MQHTCTRRACSAAVGDTRRPSPLLVVRKVAQWDGTAGACTAPQRARRHLTPYPQRHVFAADVSGVVVSAAGAWSALSVCVVRGRARPGFARTERTTPSASAAAPTRSNQDAGSAGRTSTLWFQYTPCSAACTCTAAMLGKCGVRELLSPRPVTHSSRARTLCAHNKHSDPQRFCRSSSWLSTNCQNAR